MGTFKEKLKAARLPERSISVCLRGDLTADFEAAERDLKAAQESSVDSKEGVGVGSIIERIDALREEMREHTEEFRLRAMPQPAFRALVGAHPPRRDDEGTLDAGDVQLGFNRDTFFEALLRMSVISPDLGVDVAGLIKEFAVSRFFPVEIPDGDWPELLAVLTDRQYNDLTDAAWFVNRTEVSVPFSSAASLAKRNSGGE